MDGNKGAEFWANRRGLIIRKAITNQTVLNHFRLATASLGSQVCRVLVPLCGKSIYLKWYRYCHIFQCTECWFKKLFCRMYDQGHSVIGIELVEDAIQDFFNEQDLVYIKHTISDLNFYSVC